MDKFEKQRRIFTIVGILVLISAIALISVIPAILRDTSPHATPKQAAIATGVVMWIHLSLAMIFIIGARLAKLRHHISKKINLASTIFLIILGFVVLDGATASWSYLRFVSVGMFLCVFCDLAAAIVSVAAIFLLGRKRKTKAV